MKNFEPEMRIRPAIESDIRQIQDVAQRSWRAVYDDILGEERIKSRMGSWYSDDAIRERIESGDPYFVATVQGNVIGYSVAEISEEQGEIVGIYVDPDYWRREVGSSLLEKTQNELARSGVDKVRLRVFDENEIAISFYEKHSFRHVDTVDVDLEGGGTAEMRVYERDLD
ncbi:MAG: GNAT family N-acetyltransferase [Halobacteria archaeon]|nr:GNAT family N-acetyltransferase [Halobacteria archaeon]